jgi:hypothetical protein
MASAPQFTSTPRLGLAQLTAANTNRDGTGTLVDVISGGTNGTRVEHIDFAAAGNTSAGIVRLFLNDGTNTRLWKEILVQAVTTSTSVSVWMYSLDCSTLGRLLILKSGWTLKASTHNADTFNVFAVAGDF